MNLLVAFNTFLRSIFRDRTTTLEEFILINNPQTQFQVEQLEREYYASLQRGSMV